MPTLPEHNEFVLDNNELVRESQAPAWFYIGDLITAKAWAAQTQWNIELHREHNYVTLSSSGPETNLGTTADTEDDAWRSHLGVLLCWDSKPYPDVAMPGETRGELIDRLRQVTPSDDYPSIQFPVNSVERQLFATWQRQVAAGHQLLGFRVWLDDLTDEI